MGMRLMAHQLIGGDIQGGRQRLKLLRPQRHRIALPPSVGGLSHSELVGDLLLGKAGVFTQSVKAFAKGRPRASGRSAGSHQGRVSGGYRKRLHTYKHNLYIAAMSTLPSSDLTPPSPSAAWPTLFQPTEEQMARLRKSVGRLLGRHGWWAFAEVLADHCQSGANCWHSHPASAALWERRAQILRQLSRPEPHQPPA